MVIFNSQRRPSSRSFFSMRNRNTRRIGPARERHPFPATDYSPRPSKRPRNQSSIRVRQDEPEREPEPPAAAGAPGRNRTREEQPGTTHHRREPQNAHRDAQRRKAPGGDRAGDQRTQPTREDHRSNNPPVTSDHPAHEDRRQRGVIAMQGTLNFLELAPLILRQRHRPSPLGSEPSQHTHRRPEHQLPTAVVGQPPLQDGRAARKPTGKQVSNGAVENPRPKGRFGVQPRPAHRSVLRTRTAPRNRRSTYVGDDRRGGISRPGSEVPDDA